MIMVSQNLIKLFVPSTYQDHYYDDFQDYNYMYVTGIT